jgi:iron complex outermembrane receptor protein
MGTGSLSLSRIIRGLLIAGAAGALPLSAALADDTTGQTPPPDKDTGSAQLGKIEVTGTRIKRSSVEAARPINVITQQQIKATGLNSIGDILQQLPSSGAAENSRFNNGGSGRSNVDLRNLGADRLLVLLDGKRVISGLAGDVDLNTIPLSIIDHIEVLQDGASAVYGSDAITGVVNLITVKGYDGAEASAYLGKFDAHADGGGWDGQEERYDLTLGSQGDRGSVVMNVSYVNEEAIGAGHRTISKEPVVGAGGVAGSVITPSGFFETSNVFGTCPAGVTPNPTYGSCDMTLRNTPKPGRAGRPNGPSLGNFRNFDFSSDRFNYAPDNFLQTPSERAGLYVQARYDLWDNLSFKAQLIYSNRRSSEQLAPSTLALGAFGSAFADGQPVGISGQNPYNPFGEDLVPSFSASCVVAGTCESLLFLGRRFSEAGDRVFTQTVDNFQFNGSFTGYFNMLGNEWDWSAGYAYANNYESDRAGGVVNTFRLQQELGLPGAAPCAGAGSGCTPFNIFGGEGTITPAMLSYILFEQHDVVGQTMRNYTADATGQIADLPAGPLSLAVGTEYQETDGFSHPDALVTQGNTANSLIPPTEGRERTLAEYVEFDIPLAADAPFMKSVDLDIAERWSQFKWGGGALDTGNLASHTDNATTGTAALRWQTTDTLLLRATWSQGFRIPSIEDLFLADSDSAQFLTDPLGHSNPNQPINVTTGGNTGLTPEKAITQSVGFVYDPDWVPGFDVSADYYKINLNNAISQIETQLILNGCYQAHPIQADCDLIRRAGGDHSANAPGPIVHVRNLNTNVGGIKVEGVDLSAHYAFPATSVGNFKAGLDWTFTKQYVATLAFGPTGNSSQELSGTTTNGAGTSGVGSVTGGIPKQRATLNLNWTYGDWSANWTTQYVSAMLEDCTDGPFTINPPSRCPLTINFPFANGAVQGNHIGATTYHDVSATYHLDGWNTDFTLGIRNLFDKQPPVAMSAFANSFLPTYYRTPGRFFYASVGVKL